MLEQKHTLVVLLALLISMLSSCSSKSSVPKTILLVGKNGEVLLEERLPLNKFIDFDKTISAIDSSNRTNKRHQSETLQEVKTLLCSLDSIKILIYWEERGDIFSLKNGKILNLKTPQIQICGQVLNFDPSSKSIDKSTFSFILEKSFGEKSICKVVFHTKVQNSILNQINEQLPQESPSSTSNGDIAVYKTSRE